MLNRARVFDWLAILCFMFAGLVLAYYAYMTTYPYPEDSIALRNLRLHLVFGSGGGMLAGIICALIAWRNRYADGVERRHAETLRALGALRARETIQRLEK